MRGNKKSGLSEFESWTESSSSEKEKEPWRCRFKKKNRGEF